VQPFVLTTPEIPEYDINYLGKEKVDEIGTYAFSVKPKKMVKGKRYFMAANTCIALPAGGKTGRVRSKCAML